MTSSEKDMDYEKDLQFYKKRILQKTKDFLRNEETDETLKRLFNKKFNLGKNIQFLKGVTIFNIFSKK